VIDALIDAGADIEAPGSILGGGTPIADAVGFGQWRAARRLVERGARTTLWQAAALGLVDRVEERFRLRCRPNRGRGDSRVLARLPRRQVVTAEYPLEQGADLNWIGWNEQTPPDIATAQNAASLVECSTITVRPAPPSTS
jgi:hypothetical protein